MGVSHKKLSTWYVQLSQSLDAGLPMIESLSLSEGPPRRDLDELIAGLSAGQSMDELLASAPRWMSQTDRFLISAGHASGHLPEALHRLGEKHRVTAENQGKIIFAGLYPMIVIHMAVFLFPILKLIEFDESGGFDFSLDRYALEMMPMALPLWAFLVGIYVFQRHRPEWLRSAMRFIPGLRGYRKFQGLADFCYAMQVFIATGTPADEAWYGAGLVSGEPVLQKAGLAVAESIRKGNSPSQTVLSLPCFTGNFRSLYASGTHTGKLDVNMGILNREYQQTANGKLMKAGLLYPMLVMILLGLFIGSKVIAFYSQRMAPIFEMM